MDPIKLLDERLKRLEVQVLPKTNIDTSETVTDVLLNVKGLLTTALSCRDIVNSIITKMENINEFLDPLYEQNHLEVETKRQYLLEIRDRFKQFAELMVEFDTMKNLPGTKDFETTPELNDKLNTAVVQNINIHTNNLDSTTQIYNCIDHINEMFKTFMILFAQMEMNLVKFENPV